jgi:glycine/D-amino acid oxidase-like deaminating enzyme
MCWAADEMSELPERHGFDIDYRVGSLWTAVLPRRVKMLEEALHDARHKWGYDALRLIGRDELPQWIDSPRYQAALYDAKGAHLNPLKLAQGLASTIEAAGGRIYEQSQVLSYQRAGEGYVARTDRGEVRCQVLVLACNAYIDRLDRNLSRRLLPVGSYQVATAPLDADFARSLLPRNSCVIDNQFVPDYFRITPDHRLLFGGGCTYLGGIPKDVASATRPYLERVFPQLAGVVIDYAWGGHIDCSIQRTPDVGREGQRYWLQGFSGHGVLPTLAAARAVSDAILGDDDLLTLYQGIDNGRFPGGDLLAAPLEAAAKAWYRMRDRI